MPTPHHPQPLPQEPTAQNSDKAILLTNVNNSGEDVMVFTTLDATTIAQAYQNPTIKPTITFDECYEVPLDHIQYYLYEPAYLSHREEHRARQLAESNPNPRITIQKCK